MGEGKKPQPQLGSKSGPKRVHGRSSCRLRLVAGDAGQGDTRPSNQKQGCRVHGKRTQPIWAGLDGCRL